ncbi:uncharacterized protein BN796_01259 [Alistipes sp. CAG:831]|nr:uncharacterized protein BN796_01259 [Alistipes sp. CAG:831]
MKKFILILSASVLFSLSCNAQGWAVGGRTGATVQFDAQYHWSKGYVEGRFGAGFCNYGGTVTADFSLMYNWKACRWYDWTPDAGTWFLDAGVGINVGGRENYAYVGPAGIVKFGIQFTGGSKPVSLSIDWNPAFGAGIGYYRNYSNAAFNEMGLTNFGITCVVHL